jgi:DNA-binding Lrp family transcriptional regulator
MSLMPREPRQPAAEIDDTDLRIVHALQVAPRAPWKLVGEVLGLDPVTVARRWTRLERAGIAWVHTTAAPGAPSSAAGAWLEVATVARHTDAVAAALAAEPTVTSLRRMAGGRDLIALLPDIGLADLADLVNERLATVPGVRSTRTHIITATPALASEWRLDRLDPSEVAALRLTEPAADPRLPADATDGAILATLERDGRAPVQQIAAEAGVSTATATRRLRGLLAGRAVHLHCDVSRGLSGFPVSAIYFAGVPAEHLDEATAVLRTVPELRICSVVAGPANLMIDVWLRTVGEVHTLEAAVSRRLAHLSWRVLDRSVTLRTYKHHGRLLTRDGRARTGSTGA